LLSNGKSTRRSLINGRRAPRPYGAARVPAMTAMGFATVVGAVVARGTAVVRVRFAADAEAPELADVGVAARAFRLSRSEAGKAVTKAWRPRNRRASEALQPRVSEGFAARWPSALWKALTAPETGPAAPKVPWTQ
jgi:hypothetical protein